MLAVSPDARGAILAKSDRTFGLGNTERSQSTEARFQHNARDARIASSLDLFAPADLDPQVRLWDREKRRFIGQPFERLDNRTSLAFAADGTLLAALDTAGNVTLIDARSGQVLCKRPSLYPANRVVDLAFSSDKKTLFLGRSSPVIFTLDVQKCDFLEDARKLGPSGLPKMSSFSLSPDGRTLASGEENGAIILWKWDAEYPEPIGQPLTGHAAAVSSMVFRPDGRMLASSSADGTVRLWDVRLRWLIGTLRTDDEDGDTRIVFSQDGKQLFSVGRHGTTTWDLDVAS